MTTPNSLAPTASGHKGLQFEQALIFEQDTPGMTASICRAADVQAAPRRREAQRADRPAGPVRAGVVRHYTRLSQKNYSPSTGFYPAGLVHDEAQPAPQREDGAPAGLSATSIRSAGLDRAGRAGADRHAGALAEDPDRHAGRGDVAGGRRAWRAVRPDGHPRAHEANGEAQRKRDAGAESAHGTNPATAALCRLSRSKPSRPTTTAASISRR
jgi:glycine dehydrogenase subunit 2